MSYQHLEVAQIVAISDNRAIGKDNQLPWHISADLKHFKRLTDGGIVIMGRKTFESMGRTPLPNRVNIVITRDLNYQTNDTDILVCHNLDEAFGQAAALAQGKHLETIWVIGGEKVFAEAMLFTDRIELTHVTTTIDNATAFYPDIPSHFELVNQSDTQTDSKNGLAFTFLTYRKK